MDLFQAAILGAVQGVTEFLPISSHAHLILVPWILGWPIPSLTFDVALHLGTLVALVIYFRHDWIKLTLSAFKLVRGNTKDPDARLALFIILATIPGGIAGLLLQHLEDEISTPAVIASALIALAVILWIAEIKGRRKTDLENITLPDAMTVGFAQVLALIPGVSRSGVTMTAALFRGMKREAAAHFSFLLSAPLIGGAVAKTMIDVVKEGLPEGQMPPFVLGIFVSAIVGYASIAVLIKYLSNHSTFVFIYYRIALGIAVLGLAMFWGFR